MIFSVKFIKKFALFSIITSIIYLIGELYFMYLFGQPHLQTLADAIAVFLLFYGGFITFKNQQSTGILCGAWGYSFCINYRAWVWRYYAKTNGEINANTNTVGNILLTLLLFSFIAFVISIIINHPKNNIK